MPIGIYPPTLQSSQSAFLYTVTSYSIYFNLQKITQFSEIGHLQIRLVRQSNNRTIVNTSKYPDGIIYKTPSQIFKANDNKYSIAILNTDLAEPWQAGCLYKVQMRFGSTEMFPDVSSFASWKKQQIDNQTFSEWSTVMIIKAISKPGVYIENNEIGITDDIISSERVEYVLTPLIIGVCNIDALNKEIVDKYKFDLYSGDKELTDFTGNPKQDFIESSGWLQHNSVSQSADTHRFNLILENNSHYTVFYSIRTVNGYEETAKPYQFTTTETLLSGLKDVYLDVDHTDVYCKENGCIKLYLTTKNHQQLSGSYVITRTSEKSDYRLWEDLQYLAYSAQEFDHTLIYQDFTIESGIKYKYAIQQENAEGIRTDPLYDENNGIHLVNFEYSYFYHNDVQLRVMLNQKISSFKHTTLTSKQDTLGDKYPHLVRNGYAYYAEFPISGLISFQMDKDQTFLQLKNKGFYYQEDLIIPRDKFEEEVEERRTCVEGQESNLPGNKTNYNSLSINTNLIDNNIFVERKFREKVEEFLNNFDYKLYKSPTEGNIVVVLNNVSMTPNATLGRMIYDFSATAYEVMDNTLENLNEFGIINIGQFETLASDEIIPSFGQISGLYTVNNKSVNIYEKIKQQEEISIGGGYKLSLQRLRSFWIERYPDKESILNKDYEEHEVVAEQVRNREVCTAELTKLNAMLAKAKNENNDKEVQRLQKEIDSLISLQTQVRQEWLDATIILAINGKNIIVAPHKLYSLTYPISSLELVASGYPVIINYVCELNQIEDSSIGVVTGIDGSRIWGQISGVFTDNDKVIKDGYRYRYGVLNESPYRVCSASNVGVIYDKHGNVLVDNTNYNLYKTLDLYAIIQEETRRQVELMYNVKDGFYLDENGNWSSGNLQYEFSGIASLDIEAEPGTDILIGKQEDGSDAIEMKIGETGLYRLSPISNLVRYIRLKEPSFAIVNYKCLTTQMKVRFGG